MRRVTIPIVVTLDDLGKFQTLRIGDEPPFTIPVAAPMPRRFVQLVEQVAIAVESPATRA